MKTLIQLLIKFSLKPDSSKSVNPDSGFTMIELLVGTVIAFLITAPLLTFVVSVLDRDVREEAKANTEQEVQTALDYIEQDLAQAIYVYDSTGINGSSQNNNPIKDQVQFPNRSPILVFWKRNFEENKIPPQGDPSRDCNEEDCDDTHIYSLVVYYHSTNNPNNIWSDAARIERLEIQDQIVNRFLPKDDPNYVIELADNGFNSIPLDKDVDDNNNLGDLQQKMNQWTKDKDRDFDPPKVLIDYVYNGTVVAGTVDCTNVSTSAQLVGTANSGFYTCADSSKTLAKVFIRGNSLARIQDNNPTCTANSTYCPTGSVTVQGRSLFGSYN